MMKAFLVTVAAAALAVGCAAAPPAPVHPPSAAHPPSPAPAQVTLTRWQACRRLRDDLAARGGAPDIPTLRAIADHVAGTPRMAADARTAVRDIDHTGAALVAVSLLRADCAEAGVPIPAP